jgi:hypothetical protein
MALAKYHRQALNRLINPLVDDHGCLPSSSIGNQFIAIGFSQRIKRKIRKLALAKYHHQALYRLITHWSMIMASYPARQLAINSLPLASANG